MDELARLWPTFQTPYRISVAYEVSAALELNTQIGRLCGVIQDNPELGFPTFALAMALFEQPSWDIVFAQATLRKWHLIDVHPSTA